MPVPGTSLLLCVCTNPIFWNALCLPTSTLVLKFHASQCNPQGLMQMAASPSQSLPRLQPEDTSPSEFCSPFCLSHPVTLPLPPSPRRTLDASSFLIPSTFPNGSSTSHLFTRLNHSPLHPTSPFFGLFALTIYLILLLASFHLA